jgi:general secretion pathway protein I
MSPRRARGPRGDGGFTLVEVLVALAIFSLAALALLRLQGASLTGAARLDERTVAAIVAKSVAVEAMTDDPAPAFGSASGEVVNAGRRWRWSRTVAKLPDTRLARIDIRVGPAGGGTAASLTLVRRVA